MRRLVTKLLETLIALGLLLSCARCVHAQNATGRATTPHAAKRPRTAQTCGPTCGLERWQVKTLTDKDAAAVNLNPDTSKTVADLYAVPAPTTSSEDTRLNATEKMAFTVRARLIGYKEEFDPNSASANKGDRDFHIVIADLQDPSKTMVVEIPDSTCGGVCASPQLQKISDARKEFASKFPNDPPDKDFRVVQGNVEVDVTGVGFFDFAHGQTGLAKNCVELHPVIAISFAQPGPLSAKIDHAAQPPRHPNTWYKCIPKAHSGGGSTPHP
jgi:hypothetical protein